MIRKAAFAGKFYPFNAPSLENELKKLTMEIKDKEDVFAVISPHAGYIYSGDVAGKTFSEINIPETVIILCPNHTGYGKKASVMAEGSWEIPTGSITVKSEIAKELLKHSSIFSEDTASHRYEHSLEVQLPFLYHFQKKVSIVPICLMHLSYNECIRIADVLVNIIKKQDEKILLVASSDMNHYESHDITLKKDNVAIDAILDLNPEKLYNNVMKNNISMCGIIPSTIVLDASLHLGAKKARLVAHKTSGNVNKDYSSVVGYAGIIIS